MNTSTSTAAPAPSVQQASIIENVTSGSGNLLVQALAGSGKTSLLAMVCNAIPRAKRVCALAFNRKNAEEFKRRLRAGIDSTTLNSMGFRAVRTAIPFARVAEAPIDRQDALEVMTEQHKYAATTLIKLTNFCKSWLVMEPNEILALARKHDLMPEDYMRITPALWATYAQEMLVRASQRRAAISLEDQVWLPIVNNWPVPEYDWVLVDETQDLNPLQVAFVLRLMAPGARCLAVGDQNQAIYAFRGADSRSMSRLQTALSATEYPLSVSYRCARSVIAEAQKLVPSIEAAPNAPEGLVTDETVVQMLASVQGGDWVVSRKNAPLAKLCLKLLAMSKPAMIMGRKDSQAEFTTLIRRSKATTVPSLCAWLSGFEKKERDRLTKAGREEQIEAISDRIETLMALCAGLDTVSEVEQRIANLFGEDAVANAIVLSSTHKAKGMEADRVYLLEDTFAPGRNEEESNLLYVGITRAKKHLVYVDGATKL